MARAAAPLKLKDRLPPESVHATPGTARTEIGGTAPNTGRKDKKATVGHFSEAMSRKLNAMAAMEGRTLQSIMGEAWDMWLESRQEKPFNER